MSVGRCGLLAGPDGQAGRRGFRLARSWPGRMPRRQRTIAASRVARRLQSSGMPRLSRYRSGSGWARYSKAKQSHRSARTGQPLHKASYKVSPQSHIARTRERKDARAVACMTLVNLRSSSTRSGDGARRWGRQRCGFRSGRGGGGREGLLPQGTIFDRVRTVGNLRIKRGMSYMVKTRLFHTSGSSILRIVRRAQLLHRIFLTTGCEQGGCTDGRRHSTRC